MILSFDEEKKNIPIEEDVPMDRPIQDNTKFYIDSINQKENKTVSRDVFNTIKGHNLLGWCVGILVIIYLLELFFNKGRISSIGSNIIEIIKLLIFSLTGYLFGTNSNKKE